MDDRIQIEGIEVFAHVGVPDEERADAQRLLFNITLWPSRSLRDLNDEIERAVNYADVCGELRDFVERRRDRLIETLANAVAAHLLERFAISRVTIELRKFVLPKVQFVSVTITREKGET